MFLGRSAVVEKRLSMKPSRLCVANLVHEMQDDHYKMRDKPE